MATKTHTLAGPTDPVTVEAVLLMSLQCLMVTLFLRAPPPSSNTNAARVVCLYEVRRQVSAWQAALHEPMYPPEHHPSFSHSFKELMRLSGRLFYSD